MLNTDVLIIGGGPIGLFSAFQASMLKMRCVVVDSLNFVGGQCSELYPEKPIYDIPGHSTILAKDLVMELLKQANRFNIDYLLCNQVINIQEIDKNSFLSITDKNLRIVSKIIVLAAGNGAFVPNKPLIQNIEQFEQKSLFYSVNDIKIFQNKNILITGGGDSAVDWALTLSDVAKKVYLVHRREDFRCAPQSFDLVINKAQNNDNFQILTPYQVFEINGLDGYINKAILKNFITNDTCEINIDYLLAFFGLKANLGPILNWGLDIENHKIKVDPICYQTNIEGIYAVGDIASYPCKLKLILTGFAEAATSLYHAYPRVFDGKTLHFEYSTNKFNS